MKLFSVMKTELFTRSYWLKLMTNCTYFALFGDIEVFFGCVRHLNTNTSANYGRKLTNFVSLRGCLMAKEGRWACTSSGEEYYYNITYRFITVQSTQEVITSRCTNRTDDRQQHQVNRVQSWCSADAHTNLSPWSRDAAMLSDSMHAR